MGEKLRLTQAVLVEGRYDKTMLENLLDATIFTTEGFGIFKNTEKKALLRRVAETRGLIVLVDSDGGGRQIRSYLTGILPRNGVIHLYIPPVEGKEHRKAHRSRAGLLGVEGIDADTLRALFAPYAVGGNTDGSNTADTSGTTAEGTGERDGTRRDTPPRKTYTKADLYERGAPRRGWLRSQAPRVGNAARAPRNVLERFARRPEPPRHRPRCRT